MEAYHYCSTIYFGSIGQQTREIGTNVTFLGITQCSYLSKWVIFGGKSELFCTKGELKLKRLPCINTFGPSIIAMAPNGALGIAT